MSTVLIALLALPSLVCAEDRIALLIGNKNYAEEVGPLKNPTNDVELVAKALRQVGFVVNRVQDAPLGDTQRAMNKYVRELSQAGSRAVGFFYYSGHGAASPDTGVNYLIPIDVKKADEKELFDGSIPLQQIIDDLGARASNATHFVIFDACRNELQLKKEGAKALGRRKGFRPEAHRAGMLIAYATAPGEFASDEGEGAGPYARALAEQLVIPGIEAVTLFREVQLKVRKSTGQDPWISFPSLPEIHLAGKPADSPAPALPKLDQRGASLEEVEVWSEVFLVPKGGTSEANSRSTLLELALPAGAQDLSIETHRQWCDERIPWSRSTTLLPVGQDGGWCRFEGLDVVHAQDAARIIVNLKSWSHNRDRCGRLRAAFRIPPSGRPTRKCQEDFLKPLRQELDQTKTAAKELREFLGQKNLEGAGALIQDELRKPENEYWRRRAEQLLERTRHAATVVRERSSCVVDGPFQKDLREFLEHADRFDALWSIVLSANRAPFDRDNPGVETRFPPNLEERLQLLIALAQQE